MKFILCLIMSCFLLAGCGHAPSLSQPEYEATSVTLWTDKTELFMEYPALVVGNESAFAVHLSDLKDFKPVTQGILTCIFEKDEGETVTVVSEAPGYPGIYRPVVTFNAAGVYNMQLKLDGAQVSDRIIVPEVRVYESENSLPLAEEGGSVGDMITFLKEQQWKIDFRTEPATRHKLSSSVEAVGEILPQAHMHAEVPAPVDGVILADQNTALPSVGQWVDKKDVLAVISPPANTKMSLSSIRSEYLLAKAEYERAHRLYDKAAISQKRLQEARLRFETHKAGFDVVSRQVDFSEPGKDDGMAAVHFHLMPPIEGIIQEIHFHLGENVSAGKRLFTITNPKNVLLKAHVPVARLALIQGANDASFSVEGIDREFRVSELNGRLISIGSIVDADSRTVPVLFRLDNPGNLLKIGMFAEVSVKTGDIVEALAIPNSAIFDDNGTPVAYVHLEGESFAKRILRTGIVDRGYSQVLSGIAVGDRVTTVGGYQVRLASLSTSVPTGHGHEH